jgi:hypothetical protein
MFREGVTNTGALPCTSDAVREWYKGLNIDGVELPGTAHELYVTPRYGEKVAFDYAQGLPPAPRCPL